MQKKYWLSTISFLVVYFAAAVSAIAADNREGNKGYDITKTGLTPRYPSEMSCSPLTSLYASWDDVDGTRRDEAHSGVDGGRLGDPILSPASGEVAALWRADWGWGEEQALLVKHSEADLGLKAGRGRSFYSEFDHLNLAEPLRLSVGDMVSRGQRLGTVSRPGGVVDYLPEVHWEVWQVATDSSLTWHQNKFGGRYWTDKSARLIDPLYMLSLNDKIHSDLNVTIHPFDANGKYSNFLGFTYILPCTPVQPSKQSSASTE